MPGTDLFNLSLGLVAGLIAFFALMWFAAARKRMPDAPSRYLFQWIVAGNFFFVCYVIVHTFALSFLFGSKWIEFLLPIGFVFAFFAAISFIKSAIVLYEGAGSLNLPKGKKKP